MGPANCTPLNEPAVTPGASPRCQAAVASARVAPFALPPPFPAEPIWSLTLHFINASCPSPHDSPFPHVARPFEGPRRRLYECECDATHRADSASISGFLSLNSALISSTIIPGDLSSLRFPWKMPSNRIIRHAEFIAGSFLANEIH